jgi:hypothetical protein
MAQPIECVQLTIEQIRLKTARSSQKNEQGYGRLDIQLFLSLKKDQGLPDSIKYLSYIGPVHPSRNDIDFQRSGSTCCSIDAVFVLFVSAYRVL